MAAVLPEPHSEVVDELHPAPTPGADEEIVDLNAEATPAPAPAATPAKGAQPAAQPQPAPGGEEDDDIPEEYRGKSVKEIARMHREAQQLIGRQGAELGEFRKKADLLIQASLANLQAARGTQPQPAGQPNGQPAAEEKIDEVDFFRSPQEAIAKAIANNPVIKEIRATLGQTAATQAEQRALAATQRFNAAHPDAPQIMADPEFQKWVGASRVRSSLLHRAHTAYDFDAGDEVFGTWKALKSIKAPVASAQPASGEGQPAADAVSEAARTLAAQRRKQAVNDAAAPSGGNAAPSKGSAKKIYRRADVLALMESNPDRYEQLAPEIEAAYREGRVR